LDGYLIGVTEPIGISDLDSDCLYEDCSEGPTFSSVNDFDDCGDGNCIGSKSPPEWLFTTGDSVEGFDEVWRETVCCWLLMKLFLSATGRP